MADTAATSAQPGLIFVSIASYRDSQLVPTVRDCLEKACHPERLRFGICWQHASDEELPEWFSRDQFSVVDVDYRDSRGACWARAQVAESWDEAQWYLQLDSHHRFVPDWDSLLLAEVARTTSDRPVLTTYAPPFSVDEPVPAEQVPMSMQFRGFNPNGMPMFMPRPIDGWRQRKRPHRARFVSGHFLFAPRRFVRDIPCDPDVYFGGEEITLTVRAFTHGYDLFEPSGLILWHEYSRAYRRKHWDDHLGDGAPAWYERDAATRQRVRQLFDKPDFGRFGFGTERTLEEYEAYAGISFQHRKVQDYTRLNLEPPNPPADDDWPQHVLKRRVEVTVDLSRLPAEALGEPQRWSVHIYDGEGSEIHSQETDPAELAENVVPGEPITLAAEFECEAQPAAWALIALDGTAGWRQLLDGTIDGSTSVDLYARRPYRVPGITWDSSGDRYVGGLPGETSRTHELNSSGALLVELADGYHSIREIAAYLRHAYQLDDDPLSEIFDFYEEARSAGLVTLEPSSPQ